MSYTSKRHCSCCGEEDASDNPVGWVAKVHMWLCSLCEDENDWLYYRERGK